MDPTTPWLLLVIAVLLVGCVSFYHQLRQVESQSRGHQSVIADELRDAEAALLSALEKLQKIDTNLSTRERQLSDSGSVILTDRPGQPAPEPEDVIPGGGQGRSGSEPPPAPSAYRPSWDEPAAASRENGPHPALSSPLPRLLEERPGVGDDPVLELARRGMTVRAIARELELPVGQVELALSLRSDT